MTVESHDAEAAISTMKVAGLARLVHPSHGRSVTRYRQVADENFRWSPEQAALMAVLLLRGPQTTNELKIRCERQYSFSSLDEVEVVLRDLCAPSSSFDDQPMVVQLERSIGQKELRWQQLLADEAEQAPRHVAVAPAGGLADRVAEMEARIARLEQALADFLA